MYEAIEIISVVIWPLVALIGVLFWRYGSKAKYVDITFSEPIDGRIVHRVPREWVTITGWRCGDVLRSKSTGRESMIVQIGPL